jgi:hypothetical protein
MIAHCPFVCAGFGADFSRAHDKQPPHLGEKPPLSPHAAPTARAEGTRMPLTHDRFDQAFTALFWMLGVPQTGSIVHRERFASLAPSGHHEPAIGATISTCRVGLLRHLWPGTSRRGLSSYRVLMSLSRAVCRMAARSGTRTRPITKIMRPIATAPMAPHLEHCGDQRGRLQRDAGAVDFHPAKT